MNRVEWLESKGVNMDWYRKSKPTTQVKDVEKTVVCGGLSAYIVKSTKTLTTIFTTDSSGKEYMAIKKKPSKGKIGKHYLCGNCGIKTDTWDEYNEHYRTPQPVQDPFNTKKTFICPHCSEKLKKIGVNYYTCSCGQWAFNILVRKWGLTTKAEPAK